MFGDEWAANAKNSLISASVRKDDRPAAPRATVPAPAPEAQMIVACGQHPTGGPPAGAGQARPPMPVIGNPALPITFGPTAHAGPLAHHPQASPAGGPPPGAGQIFPTQTVMGTQAFPGFLLPMAGAGPVGSVASHGQAYPAAGYNAQPPPLYPPGFRIQDNLVLRHDWPQGHLQPSSKHLEYERSKDAKPAQENATWCNSCEYWLWNPCYSRVPLSARDNARCCNRCHMRKKRARGMGLHQWMLAAQPLMLHLLKKDPGYAA
ncbi:hypothetical protein LX32DRAFT_641281 [Colletotrichum zoysiae]|uniref:Uncharacterized protein n=1 Tax=Colletotrichum zoysiae TaxID=1216348 RepID=A0AAD9HFK2_9PEZI|nr:hypothetical protein LX32DRAFT_641281 [Colletotrichum zoysiae]